MYIYSQQENNHKNQLSCFLFIYSMAFLHKSPHHCLKIPQKVQIKLVWNFVASACKSIKLQLCISSTWSLFSHTEA